MAARYKVHLKDQSGNLVAIIDDFTNLQVSHRLNSISTYNFQIDASDPVVDLFELDGQIEIYRNDSVNGIDWYLEFEGFHRNFTTQTFENGRETYTSYGRCYNDLLNRRIIAYYSGSAYASKSGVGETVMKEYVDENAGPGATNPPRVFDGVTLGLSIEADAARGDAWAGSKSWQNLLTVCQQIANVSNIDFDIVGTGAQTFEFRVYDEQLGSDRTTDGLDIVTGLNGAGNAPVIFALAKGNMQQPTYSLKRMNEKNAVLVLGEGIADDRETEEREDATAIADSPWNRCETTKDARNYSTVAGYQSVGDNALEEGQAEELFDFVPLQVESTLYGRDYFFGDKITARYKDFERDKKIISVDILVNQEGSSNPEKLSIVLGDILP